LPGALGCPQASAEPAKRKSALSEATKNLRVPLLTTRKAKEVGKQVQKLLLNLLVIASFGTVGWSCYSLATHQVRTQLGAMMVTVSVGFSIFSIWLLRRPSFVKRKPSFKLTFSPLIAVLLVCSFIGVEPLASYKDDVLINCRNTIAEWEQHRKERQEESIVSRENEVFSLVNVVRSDNGLPPLQRDNLLDSLAKGHSRYMAQAGTVSHKGFDARADKIFGELGTSYVGENCAEGYYSAASLVEGWLNSPGHRENILDPSFRRTGIGCEDNYATQIFCD